MPDVLMSSHLREYLEQLVPDRPDELLLMERYAKENSFPIVGPACGQLCYILAKIMGAKKVFEMGSGYGYSTYWFGRAVKENGGGVVHHVVWDEDLSKMAQQHLARLGVGHLIRYHVSEAIETLNATNDTFDIIFNDIDKHAYPDSLLAIEPKLKPGGILIIDNMLWQGRIFDRSDNEPNTKGVRTATAMLRRAQWVSSLIPIRDGLIVAMKR